MSPSWDHRGPGDRSGWVFIVLGIAAVGLLAVALAVGVARAGVLSERDGLGVVAENHLTIGRAQRIVGGHSRTPQLIASRSESTPRWPTPAAMRWQPPTGFLQQAFCIHNHESVDWYRAYTDWQGQPSSYSGGMQFTLSTWRRAGGTGHPHEWRPREQVYRAFVIWRRTGWSEWGSAWKCGLA